MVWVLEVEFLCPLVMLPTKGYNTSFLTQKKKIYRNVTKLIIGIS